MASAATVHGQHHRGLRQHLANQPCPNCNSDRSSGVDGDPLIRCCVACQNVFGFDDSTAEVELFQHVEIAHGRDDEHRGGGRYEDDGYGGRSGSRNARNESQEYDEGERNGRGGGGGCGSGGGSSSGRPGSGGREGCRGCCQNGGGSRRPGGDQTHLARSASVEAVIGSGMRVAGSLLGSFGSGSPDQMLGNVVRATTNEMEPIGQQVGAIVGALAGSVIGCTRGAELGGNMGATVGRGMAEMVRDSQMYPNGSATARGQLQE